MGHMPDDAVPNYASAHRPVTPLTSRTEHYSLSKEIKAVGVAADCILMLSASGAAPMQEMAEVMARIGVAWKRFHDMPIGVEGENAVDR